jgi:hypothetical protein
MVTWLGSVLGAGARAWSAQRLRARKASRCGVGMSGERNSSARRVHRDQQHVRPGAGAHVRGRRRQRLHALRHHHARAVDALGETDAGEEQREGRDADAAERARHGERRCRQAHEGAEQQTGEHAVADAGVEFGEVEEPGADQRAETHQQRRAECGRAHAFGGLSSGGFGAPRAQCRDASGEAGAEKGERHDACGGQHDLRVEEDEARRDRPAERMHERAETGAGERGEEQVGGGPGARHASVV